MPFDYTEIIDFLPDATFVIDSRGIVVAWNRAIEKMTGVPAAEIVGKGDFAYGVPFYGKKRPILIDLVEDRNPQLRKHYDVKVIDKKTLHAEAFVASAYGGKGADLSVFGGGATQAAFGARGAASLLHKLTVWGFVAFIVTTVSI